MSNYKKTLADVKPGGRVRLGDQALSTSEGARRYVADFFAKQLRRHDFGNYILTELAADFACALAQHLSAQPSPGGQDALPPLPPMGYEVRGTGMGPHDVYYTPAAYTAEQMQDYACAALATRQPVGEPVGEPVAYWLAVDKDGIVEFGMSADDGNEGQAARQEVNDFINGALHDGGVPHRLVGVYAAPTAQAVDLGAVRGLLQRRIAQWRSHLPADPGAPGTREIETKGEHDYNNDVRIFREGVAVMAEVLHLIDSQGAR